MVLSPFGYRKNIISFGKTEREDLLICANNAVADLELYPSTTEIEVISHRTPEDQLLNAALERGYAFGTPTLSGRIMRRDLPNRTQEVLTRGANDPSGVWHPFSDNNQAAYLLSSLPQLRKSNILDLPEISDTDFWCTVVPESLDDPTLNKSFLEYSTTFDDLDAGFYATASLCHFFNKNTRKHRPRRTISLRETIAFYQQSEQQHTCEQTTVTIDRDTHEISAIVELSKAPDIFPTEYDPTDMEYITYRVIRAMGRLCASYPREFATELLL